MLALCMVGPVFAQCPGDAVPTGDVDAIDVAAVLGAWGTDGQGAFDTDLNDDGLVDAIDLSILLEASMVVPLHSKSEFL